MLLDFCPHCLVPVHPRKSSQHELLTGISINSAYLQGFLAEFDFVRKEFDNFIVFSVHFEPLQFGHLINEKKVKRKSEPVNI